MKRRLLPKAGSPVIFKVLAFALFTLFFTGNSQAQQSMPEWSISFAKTEVTQCDEVELIYTCKIPDTWYIYSNNMDPELGPILPGFTYQELKDMELIDKTPKPVGYKTKFDETWEGEVSIFVKKLEFRQKVKFTGLNPGLKLAIEFQMCSEVSGQCILFDFEKVVATPKVKKSDAPCSGMKPKPANPGMPV